MIEKRKKNSSWKNDEISFFKEKFGTYQLFYYFCMLFPTNNVNSSREANKSTRIRNMKLIDKLANWYFTKRALPYWGILVIDCLIVLSSGLVCYTLDHGAVHTAQHFGSLLGTLLFYLLFFMVGFRIMKTYMGVMRYTSFADLHRVLVANLIGIILIMIFRLFRADFFLEPIRLKDLIFTFILSTIIMSALRLGVKWIYDYAGRETIVKSVYIYGVKNGGMGIARSVINDKPQRFKLAGFVSDAPDMIGKILMGVNVFKNDAKLPYVMRKNGVRTLLVSPLKQEAFSNNPAMIDRLIDAGVKIYTMNPAVQWDGKSEVNTSQLREVEIEDLLPRDEIRVDLHTVENEMKGKRVLVTGSAGSIGSEMVRQIAKFDPAKMVLIDQAETPQHDIRLMMAKDFPHVKVETIVTTICNKTRMEAIFKMFRPQYVFHAAAYKHVPMMEDNPCEAVQNNIDGTRIIADLAVKYGTEKFVMISTDKAVNPTNVMGCSKRICEIYVQSLDKAIKDGKIKGETQFVTTRFGNVLGSNGSVIPLFREQIRKGGPVTVTHPNIFRYFMLIPEACKLVLEAGTMGKGGEIFVFDMGKPVKIADLAKRMIRLSGAMNVQIEYTGLRDGEKLYEEVLNNEEITKPTFNKKIKIASVREYDFDQVAHSIDQLIAHSYEYDVMNTVKEMKSIVPEFKSNHSVYESLD